jgi:hypothetical protein
MPRFVLLRHETPPGYPRPAHYDLMLEQGELLWTWALDRLPAPNQPATAERLKDHRPFYLDFEGQLSSDRGSVQRIDQGHYDLLNHSPDRLELHLHGQSLNGRATLILDAATQRWCVSLSAD